MSVALMEVQQYSIMMKSNYATEQSLISIQTVTHGNFVDVIFNLWVLQHIIFGNFPKAFFVHVCA